MSRLKAYLQLLRAPATPTAVSNILMGYLVANRERFLTDHFEYWTPVGPLAMLILASVSLYSAGMVLNDVVDIDEDRRLRPNRPIPSGQIRNSTARSLGWGLLACGILFAVVAGWLASREGSYNILWRCAVTAIALALAIVAYDFFLKRTWFGPLGMGLCRTLNVLLGMSTMHLIGPETWLGFSIAGWAIAGGIGAFVAGVSWLALREADLPRRRILIGGATVIAVALVWLASLPGWCIPTATVVHGPLNFRIFGLFALIAIPIGIRIAVAIAQPNHSSIQRAVVTSLFSIVFIDAILCFAATAGMPSYSLAIVGLLVPSSILARWAKAT